MVKAESAINIDILQQQSKINDEALHNQEDDVEYVWVIDEQKGHYRRIQEEDDDPEFEIIVVADDLGDLNFASRFYLLNFCLINLFFKWAN